MSGDQPSVLNHRLKAQRLEVKFEDDWPAITAVLDKSIRDPLIEGRKPTGFGNVSYTDYMDAYTKVYNLTGSSDAGNVRAIYPALSSYFFGIADEMLAGVASADTVHGHAFLLAYLDAYDRFLSGALLLPKLFRVYDTIVLKHYRDGWLTAIAPGNSHLPPGVGHRRENSWSGQQPRQGHKPTEPAEIPDDIMQYDHGTPTAAPKAAHIAALLWPPEGAVIPSEDKALDAIERAQCDARPYSSTPANVYMQLVPTLLRLWPLATVKHLGSNTKHGPATIVHNLEELGALKQHVDIARRLAKCYWAIGVSEQELGFEELIDVLRSAK